PGVEFERTAYTPRAIPNVAAHPRFAGLPLKGVRVAVADAGLVEPLELGMHVLAAIAAQARALGIAPLFPNLKMLHAVAGTRRLGDMLLAGKEGAAIIAAWQSEVAHFKERRAPYLLY